ncbi:MAG: BREX-2 system phosphatase PglZ [Myxococcota bacterium]
MSELEVPRLTQEDLERALHAVYGAQRRHSLVALYGTGDEGTVQVGGADVQVVPVRSELELRERMPPLADEHRRVAFLVPFTQDVPLDLSGRFALRGRVRKIGKEARLKRLFGVGEVAPKVAQSPLAEYLLRPGNEQRYGVGSGNLTEEAMWVTWLQVDWGLDAQGGVAIDALLGWAAMDGRGDRFREEMTRPEAAGVRDALLELLERSLGPAGPVVWRAWENRRGRELLAHAVVFEVLADRTENEARLWVGMRLRDRFGVDEASAFEVARLLGVEAGAALRYVAQQGDEGLARLVVREADDLADVPELRPHLRRSTRLPSAWQLRIEALGEALQEGAASPTVQAVERAQEALAMIEGHERYTEADQTQLVKQSEMALRLLAWLAVRTDRRYEPGATAYGDVEALGRWYVEEGGYVDWARRWASGASGGALAKGIEAVVRVADAARMELDQRFAKALAEWVDAGRPSHQVVPIDDAVRRIATRFLDDNPERKLLVLLFDGMSWSQAVEILRSMGQRASPWGPLAWHHTRKGRIGESPFPVVLSNLPSITDVSRSAFFAGKTMPPGKDVYTRDDPKRWVENKDVAKYTEGTMASRLLLKAESHTGGGGATQEALSLVADGDRRVVGIVLNAIDDAIKSNAAVVNVHDWSVDSIASLPVLLEKAREHGRAVLMASDHGHVSAGRFQTIPKLAGQGARWRPWREGEPVHESEVVFRVGKNNGVWAPKGYDGVALPADDVHIYGSSTGAGEHGGATLAEVVAPCLLVGCEDVAGNPAQDDPALAVRATHMPAWWHYDLQERSTSLPSERPPPPKKPKKPVDDRQLALLEEPKATAEEAEPMELSAFASSDVLAAQAPKKRDREAVVRVVEFLLARGGVASKEQFASGLEILEFRVDTFVAKFQEVLNVDGYQVLRYDPTAKQVHLDRGKLAQLFEVEL